MKRYFVYKVTNLINGKIYVGITSKPTIQHRWKEHVYAARGKRAIKKHFYKAIAKYGPENFSIQEIDEALGLDAALEKEKGYILSLNTLDRDVGYNLIACSFNGVNHVSDETREKQSLNGHSRATTDRAGLDTAPNRPNKFISHIAKDKNTIEKRFRLLLKHLKVETRWLFIFMARRHD